MIEGRWNKWIGKYVYIILKNHRQYSGTFIDVDYSSSPLIWITIKDKYGKEVIFNEGEIEVIQEEGR